MLPALFDLEWRRDQTHSMHAFPTPALEMTEERATRCVAGAGKIKSLGHPPGLLCNDSPGGDRSLRRNWKPPGREDELRTQHLRSLTAEIRVSQKPT